MSSIADRTPPIRKDLEITPQYYRGELCYVVKDPVTGNFYRLREPEYVALKCFERGMGVEEARDEINRLTGAEVAETEVYKFANQLQNSDLLKSKGMGDVRRIVRNAALQKKAKFRSVISNYLWVTIPLWDPDRTLDRLLPVFRFLTRPLFVAGWLAAAGIGLWIILTHARALMADAFSLLSGWNLLILSGAIFAKTFIHEMGHALTCKHLGGHVRAIGPALLVFQPCMFTDVTDAWTFPSRWDRIKVSGAGVVSEIILGSVAAFVWISSEPGLVKQICYALMVTCTLSTVLFNANPLLRFDGYYILSDLLEMPNLRIRADQHLGCLFDRYVLGVDTPIPEATPADGRIYLVYGIARFFYTWLIMLAIGFLLLGIFVPLGVVMIASSFYGMILTPVWKRAMQLGKQFQAGKVHLRALLVLAVIFLLTAGVFLVPIDYRIQAPCVVEPGHVTIVRTPAEGDVAEILVREGQSVRKGQKVAQMANPELVHRAQAVREKIAESEAKIRAALATDAAEVELEQAEKNKLTAELEQLEDEIASLCLVAPHDGVVVNLHRSEVATQAPQHMRVLFPPADPDVDMKQFEGMRLSEGTGLLAVARMDEAVLRAFVYERDVSSLKLDQPCEYVLVSQPSELRRSQVRSLAPVDVKTIENVGVTLADIGYIPVEPGAEGKKRPLVTLYVAEAAVPQGDANLSWGLTGKASITYGRGPLGPHYVKKIIAAIKLRLQRI